jgi:methylenetetrahydrofolate dehydrogenase (NADP+)/methenyltetrahydrofolate cyclohydrolase
MQLLDGKACAAAIKKEVAVESARLTLARKPLLALVRVGEDPASKVYVAAKAKACEECGIDSRNVVLPDDTSEARVLDVLREFNDDRDVDGILLQLPLPRHIDSDRAIASISPEKDVDGFHPESLGRLAAGTPRFVPCTPLGIRELLIRNGIATAGAHAVILGRSVIVGKPMALLLGLKGAGGDATVTTVHSRSRNIEEHTRRADILIAAMGVPKFVKKDMVKDGAVVVDVGINRVDDPSLPKGYALVGDVDFDVVAPRTSFITPVPGGVGPMTVAMLMSNTLAAFRMRTEK